jgi:hypothetical protein
MPTTDLTPVERGTLLVLMAEARPLKESSELKAVHGIALKGNHRAKLRRLGLINTTEKPFVHSLSEKGWQWARHEISAPKPKGLMGMGALYSVLHGVRRHIERHGYQLEDVFRETQPDGPDSSRRHMHEAAWSEADEALGQALQDIPILTTAIETLQQAPTTDLNSLIKRTSAAAKLVVQSVRHAGTKRDLMLVMEVGTETKFDPTLHRSNDSPHPGDRVRVRKPPVVQGSTNASVVVQGEVEPI